MPDSDNSKKDDNDDDLIRNQIEKLEIETNSEGIASEARRYKGIDIISTVILHADMILTQEKNVNQSYTYLHQTLSQMSKLSEKVNEENKKLRKEIQSLNIKVFALAVCVIIAGITIYMKN
jgi:hypothetical protein